MANFDAQITLSANAQKAINSIQKVEKRVERLDKKASDIDIKFDIQDQEIRRAERLLRNLERTRKVKLQVDERITRSGGGGSNFSTGVTSSAFAGAFAASATRPAKTVQTAFKQTAENADKVKAAVQEMVRVQGIAADLGIKINANKDKTAARVAEITELERKIPFIQGNVTRLTNKQNSLKEKGRKLTKKESDELLNTQVTLGEMKNELDRLNKSKRLLAEYAEQYTAQLKAAEDRIDGIRRKSKGLQQGAGINGGGPGGGGGRGGRRGGGLVPAAAGGALGGLQGGLVKTLGAIVGVNEALQETRRILTATLDRSASEQRLRALSNGWDSYADTLQIATDAAQKFNISQTEAQSQIAQVYGRLRPLGLTLQEIESTYVGFNTAARLSGATAAESAGAFLQLSQALGAGALRGEEFNSVAEQAPAVLSAIAKRMDEPVGALKELAKEGKITREIVLGALQDIEKAGAGRLADVLDSPAAKVAKLNSKLDDLRVELGELSLPAFIGLVEGLTGAIEGATKATADWQLALKGANRDINSIGARMPGWGRAIRETINQVAQTLNPLAFLFESINLSVGALANRQRDLAGPAPTEYDRTQGAGLNMSAIRAMSDLYEKGAKAAGDLATNTGSAGNNGEELIKSLTRQIALQQKYNELTALNPQDEVAQLEVDLNRQLAELQNDRLSTIDQIAEITDVENRTGAELLEAELARLRVAGLRLDTEQQIAAVLRQQAIDAAGENAPSMDTVNGRRGELERLTNIAKFGTDGADFLTRVKTLMTDSQLSFNEAFELEEAVDNMTKLAEATQRQEQLMEAVYQRIGRAIEDSMVQGIEAAITGAEKLEDVLQNITANLLRDLGRMFINAGLKGIGAGLDIPGFATGGVVPPNTTALVGERGPELLRTGGQTAVVSNNSATNEALGRYTYRDNSAFRPSTINANISYDGPTLNFNGDDYIPRSEAPKLVSMGAKAGEASVMARFRNSRSTRKQVGL